jgi:hypothetical protein
MKCLPFSYCTPTFVLFVWSQHLSTLLSSAEHFLARFTITHLPSPIVLSSLCLTLLIVMKMQIRILLSFISFCTEIKAINNAARRITSTVRKYKIFQRHNVSNSLPGANYFHVNAAQVLLIRTEKVLWETATSSSLHNVMTRRCRALYNMGLIALLGTTTTLPVNPLEYHYHVNNVKHSVPTSKNISYVSMTKINSIMLLRENRCFFSDIHETHKYTRQAKCRFLCCQSRWYI